MPEWPVVLWFTRPIGRVALGRRGELVRVVSPAVLRGVGPGESEAFNRKMGYTP